MANTAPPGPLFRASIIVRAFARGRSVSVWVDRKLPCVRLPDIGSLPIMLGPQSHPAHGGRVKVSTLGVHFNLLGSRCHVPWFAIRDFRVW